MNAAVKLLEDRLKKCNWGTQEWLFLWVSNRKIENDTTADPRLLWVGKKELVSHAPLIGRRGLIPTELGREEEMDDGVESMET